MKCPLCGFENAQPLFQRMECINEKCENFSEEHQHAVFEKAADEFTITDEELDAIFDGAFSD